MGRVDEFRAPSPRDDEDGWLPPEEAAQRMGITVPELDDLVRRGALRARRDGWAVLVQPAIVNVRPEKPSPKRGSGTTKSRPRTPVRGRK
ncbi:DNA-binding protein [Mycobacterium colombiense]